VVVAFFPAAFTGGGTKEMSGRVREEAVGLLIRAPSDFTTRKTAEAYGALMPERGIANRATFVVDKQGKITYIEEGNSAVDITGTADACSRLSSEIMDWPNR